MNTPTALDTALDTFTHALINGADSITLAVAFADLTSAARAHIIDLHEQETTP